MPTPVGTRMIAQVEPKRMDLETGGLPAIEGMVQVFTAAQRSFFTAVIAQAIQTAAQGRPTLLVQFLKGGIGMGPDQPIQLCQNLRWIRCGLPNCVGTPSITAAEQAQISALWHYTQTQIQSDQFSLVILDELSLALHLGFIPEAECLAMLEARPRRLDLVLTGPHMPEAILNLADQITELRRSVFA
ncbi:P-loop NTPase family protein [Lyngbya confervoides]